LWRCNTAIGGVRGAAPLDRNEASAGALAALHQ
jgi:hypothetical protein